MRWNVRPGSYFKTFWCETSNASADRSSEVKGTTGRPTPVAKPTSNRTFGRSPVRSATTALLSMIPRLTFVHDVANEVVLIDSSSRQP